MPFGTNLIKNGDAEQGQCYHSNQSSITAALQGWSRHGGVIQIYYNNNDLKMYITNYTTDWHLCFFFGGNQYSDSSNSNENTIRQEINVKQLSILINSRQARYHASAYLGGFEDEQSSASMKIGFKNTRNKTEYIIVGPVTNVDLQNKTAILFCSYNGTVPNDTLAIGIELKFHRQKSHSGLRFGMTDNLKFVIEQK
ncbi:unnamed protein product [Didymodactylos carnosus]|uniref:Uncharacterized protein n=1 Tax=Didymodactylos carnosus TaxID=1234261 RepID=A0A814V0J7_9BILA|nr:unnamed protein product [Didymodactylos carnosus]CAF1430858.1 unnamed protein product [Didymodactylos carnosus]CAF3944632.1 unnamed protein product [Didymodactylos carnosus]CAF4228953.1 unnamed protein product [Didymodactylos carnosus]